LKEPKSPAIESGTMNLMQLIAQLPITGELAADAEVTGITHDSRQVSAGDLFVAMVGERFDGRVFARQAAERGAVAALGSGEAPAGLEIPWLRTESPRAILGPLASRLYGHPDRELLTVGITGTNGKSTTVALVAAILDAAGRPAGRIGTLGYRFRDLEIEGERTTPEASDLFRSLRRMRDAGAESLVMEVSSHALAMERVEGMGFDVAVFTNLTRDHFDFHHGFEDYYAAKRRLFDQLDEGGRAVVNVDDPYGRRLAHELPGVLTFGSGAAVEALASELDSGGIRARFCTPRGEFDARSPLLGRFNLENLTAAVAAAEALELPHEAIVEGLAGVAPLPGRMEPVEAGQDFPVLIDYAHTDAALAAAVRSLRSFAQGKVLLVFGCGGDRDAGKRVLMGRVAGELADLPIVTSDNPRGEDPLTIITAVEQGLKQSGNEAYRVVPDRREAIRRAVAHADAGWSVLVAGKGHEEVQLIGEEALPFSDRDELRRALEERIGARTRG
jgi:UDP-N-acetylmuramoyl-L-alanyl-D-glutamate--2,6-diaminopimelate ligase